MEEKAPKRKIIKPHILGFICGGITLSLFSALQKILIGIDPLIIKAYIVPALFGGITGGVLFGQYSRIRTLNASLIERNRMLEELLPICSYCKSIRREGADPKDPEGWHSIESYLESRTNSRLSHGICPDCMRKEFPGIDSGSEE